MKKIFGFIAIVAMMFVAWSCGGATDSPSAVAEKAIQCLQDRDYDGYAKLIYLEEKDNQSIEDQQKAIVALIADKMDKEMDKKQGISSYEVLGEEIAEDGNKAKVNLKITYGDGSTDDQRLKCLKTDDGKWMIDANK
ncbi:MAG: DUF4878 domain-containing protein [Prevotella sp.]|mgnify:FL=1|nr:DUF4878 domain-containing protein [Prevotella sp.]MBR2035261.1 DUF4878 domain-containing protein [Prevotella sp.]MBR6593421.1 DUF4878 domain-containing protein [Prevotella sp.]